MKIKKNNNKTVFLVVLVIALTLIIAGIIMLCFGIPQYKEFISQVLKQNAKPSHSPIFIYGVFLLVLAILLLILDIFIANDIWNKKLQVKEIN
ncbi:hypothetical protein [Mesomycoplasma hyopneumoniae]|uniref:hypothetical protein n=1 Tax=Mesomycoplasma hyopneumoniae TaxID=2099 RepID=UPI00215D682F|nr:hypothetical protein [Mesomycoplasma hyopneumoniae]